MQPSQPVFMKLRICDLFHQDPLKRLDNKRQNKTTLLLFRQVLYFCKKDNLQEPSLQQHCAVFHFQMPLEKSIIFLNHRNGFCECDVLWSLF
jgi:hypothetical protein